MQTVIIELPDDAGQRLDKFLKKYLPNLPLAAIYKLLRTGKIKVNRKKQESNYRLELGDEIRFFLDTNLETQPITTLEEKKPTPHLEILYEDDDIIAINKPPGLTVHPGDHKTTESSLIEQVQDHLWGKYDTLTWKPSLVHRIDRDTSGVILIAKTKRALEPLLKELQSHDMRKIYHAICIGTPDPLEGTIRKRLLRHENATNEAKVQVHPDGQTAVTHYRTKGSDLLGKYSLIECRLETGRTHQIRVHLASLGCPILGDKLYGSKGENSYASRTLGIGRQLLHAASLSFLHPITKVMMTIHAPYQEDMRRMGDTSSVKWDFLRA